MNKKAVEIVNAEVTVIYERGLWFREEREKVKEYLKKDNIETEFHYIYVSDNI